MGDVLDVVKHSLRDLWEEFVPLVLMNLIWTLTVLLPLVPILVLPELDLAWVLALSLVLALPLPIVSGGLGFVTNQFSRGNAAGFREFIAGMRRYWAKSLVVALINVVVLALLVTNLQFYGVFMEGDWTVVALAAWIVLGVYWLLTQVFWFPMILELESEKVFLALRNALAMVFITPLFSLGLGALLAVIIALCLVLSLPAVIFMASLVLLIANHATRSRLAFVQKKPYRPGTGDD